MNYLAHAVLSGSNEEVLMGNMMGDYIKGRKYLDYSPHIQKGILLHRFIDSFTDTHKIIKDTKQVYRSDFGLYSGVFIDTVFDHFLAADDSKFTHQDLELFAQRVYTTVYKNEQLMPEKMKYIFGYMRQHNWLLTYRTQDGMFKTLINMCKRFEKPELSKIAVQLFINNYTLLKTRFEEFYPILAFECKMKLKLSI